MAYICVSNANFNGLDDFDLADVKKCYKSECLKILIIDDSEENISSFVQAFATQSRLSTSLGSLSSGENLLWLLEKDPDNSPNIILMNTDLPKKSGKDILRDIKSDERLKDIVIIMFSNVQTERDHLECLSLKADGFITAPYETEGFKKLLSLIEAHFSSSRLCSGAILALIKNIFLNNHFGGSYEKNQFRNRTHNIKRRK